jgi:hypothetical protein
MFKKMRAAFPSVHAMNGQIIGYLKRFIILSEKCLNRKKCSKG